MRALVLERKGELSLREIELPLDVGEHEVKIAIDTVGGEAGVRQSGASVIL